MNKVAHIKRSMRAAGLLALLLPGFLAACSDDAQTPQPEGRPVSFSAAFQDDGTRASLAGIGTLQATGFHVWANATDGVSELKEKFMNDQHVTWNSTLNQWVYSPLKIWPANANATVDFYAVYKGGASDGQNVRVQYDWYNKPQVTFYVNDVVSEQTDMLWAAPQLECRNADHATAPVKFSFQHALAGFMFTIKLKDGDYTGYTITVNSLTLKGYFAPKAQVMPDETTLDRAYRLQGDWMERTYTITKDGANEVSTGVSAAPGVTTTEKDLTGSKGYIMVLPFGQEYTVELNYTVVGPAGTGVHAASKTIQHVTDLAAGNMLKTLLILDPDLDPTPGPGNEGDIDLKVTLVDWKDVNAGEMEIEFE